MIVRRWDVEWFSPSGCGYWTGARRFWTLAGAVKHAGRAVADIRSASNWRIYDRKHETVHCVLARTSDVCWQLREDTNMPIAREVA